MLPLVLDPLPSVRAVAIAGLRFFTVYGPWGRPDMSVMAFARNIVDGKPIRVFQVGACVRACVRAFGGPGRRERFRSLRAVSVVGSGFGRWERRQSCDERSGAFPGAEHDHRTDGARDSRKYSWEGAWTRRRLRPRSCVFLRTELCVFLSTEPRVCF
jgi:hypothetical protein